MCSGWLVTDRVRGCSQCDCVSLTSSWMAPASHPLSPSLTPTSVDAFVRNDRLYLVEVIVVVVVIIFYLFYFGRTLGWVVSVILRTYFWRKYRAWLDIGSIQFSPLGGRLLFRDLTYVGENETIKIVMGHVTWRYWLLHVRREEDLKKDDDTLPCRTTLQLEGLEWFIYNRGPAFDALLERLGHREGRPMASDAGTMKQDSASVVKILPPSDEVGPNRGKWQQRWPSRPASSWALSHRELIQVIPQAKNRWTGRGRHYPSKCTYQGALSCSETARPHLSS